MEAAAQPQESRNYFRISKPLGLALLILVLSLVIACVLMIQRNRELVARNNARIDNSVQPKIGATIAQITGLDTFGQPVHVVLGDGGRKTLLLVFSPNCRVCGLNWPAWEKVARSVDSESYRVVYVNANSRLTSEFLQQHRIPATSAVVDEVDPGLLLRNNIMVTPETILLDSSGKIEKAWIGILEGEQLGEVENSVGISKSKQRS